MTSSLAVAALLAAALCSAGDSADSLRAAAAAGGKRVGTAVSYAALVGESRYAETVAREFSQLTCENEMKFGPIHPGRSRYDFSKPDAMLAFARAHDMLVRGHTLVWHNQVPGWVRADGTSPAKLAAILQEHIAAVVGHYRGRVYAWDVVNEAFNADGSLRKTLWCDDPGIGFAGQGTRAIEQAFRWARAADAKALLFYNDFGAEGVNAKSDAVYDMVKDFRARGVPIDGVGLQMHLREDGVPPAELAANIKRLVSLGVQVQVTELDVGLDLRKGAPTPAQLQRQAQVYRDVAAACAAQAGCTAVTAWGFTDKHSWIPRFSPGFGAAALFDEAYRPKPAYAAVRAAFLGR